MKNHPLTHRDHPEKIRSLFWLILAVILFLLSSFAESSWSDTRVDREQAGSKLSRYVSPTKN